MKVGKPFITRSSEREEEVFYIKEQAGDLEPVVICICNSEYLAQRVLKALLKEETIHT